MSLVPDIGGCNHTVRPNLALNREFVVLGIRQLVSMIEGEAVGDRLHLAPGESRIRIRWGNVGRREWERKTQPDAEAIGPCDVRGLEQRWIGAAVVQPVRRIADFKKL